jgi:threonine/homoserine/homoserine lactone efflux protein
MLFNGFKFGMLLQFAIGPVSIFIFQMSALNGFYVAEEGVLGVVLIDGLFIISAIFGIAKIIEKENIKFALKVFGAIILLTFGISMIMELFNISIIPSLNTFNFINIDDSFLHASILTASNPLTILFWAGIFSSKIVEEKMQKEDIYIFGLGAVLSTLFFLTMIAIMGNFIRPLFSHTAVKILNLTVGILLIYFSGKMILKK